jgi:hypothetical protein
MQRQLFFSKRYRLLISLVECEQLGRDILARLAAIAYMMVAKLNGKTVDWMEKVSDDQYQA